MLFNSIDFALFLPLVFGIYWALGGQRIRAQNILIVIASYVFYGWWDAKFLLLILFSTVVDYSIGLTLGGQKNERKRKLLLGLSLLVNLGLLGLFKYYNFFVDNFVAAFTFAGVDIPLSSLSIVLPVGISFYTFQTLSYTIDVYRGKLAPTRDFIGFSAFVSFFPQLVAGPIERATHLLPQFSRERRFDYGLAVDGLRQILWGLFKKIVIADNCAQYVNYAFDNYETLPGATLFLGGVFFAFQIYGDFSGYSDIAIGTARLFGFDLMQNFAYPYFSRDMAEFWRRWHISLSTWFRDYLYIPLGGSRGGRWMRIRNTFIIFLVSGFWHGANWTFIIWGLLNACYFLPLLLTNNNRRNLDVVAQDRALPDLRQLLAMGSTFSLTVVAWIFFRAESVQQALAYLYRMLTPTTFRHPWRGDKELLITIIGLICFFIIMEWVGRRERFALERFGINWPSYLRYVFYYVIIFSLFWFGGKAETFIYFQF